MARYRGINYVGRQSSEGVCVAISIINALKWAGNKTITSRHIKFVYREAGNPGEGTNSRKVLRVLKHHCRKFLKVHYKTHVNYSQVMAWLKSGNTVIMDYFCHDEKDAEIGHSVFIAGVENGKVVIINDFGRAIYRMSLQRFKKEMFTHTDFYPGVYFLRKVK